MSFNMKEDNLEEEELCIFTATSAKVVDLTPLTSVLNRCLNLQCIKLIFMG